MKTLLLARHAKSDWNHPGLSDFARPLNARGKTDAPLMAEYLQKCGYLVHQVISSDAERALSTAREYKKQLQPVNDLIIHHDLYLAADKKIMQIVKAIAADCATVMLVGHNPGMTQVLNALTQSDIENMPTCSVAIIQFDVNDWSKIKPGSGDLLGFEYPEKHYQ